MQTRHAALNEPDVSFSIELLSEDSLLLRLGKRVDIALNAEVHATANALRAANLPGINDIAPAYASLLLRFDPQAWADSKDSGVLPHQKLSEALRTALAHRLPGSSDGFANTASPPPSIEVPVCYGGACGQDLAELAARAQMTPHALIARHTAPEYTVAMLGFAPGFPYLLGLDPALQAPRRATPRTRVPAGSVAIGGAQTGIYPRELPGGWNLIGRTPLKLFDSQRAEPALLKPGDRVRFVAISSEEFASQPQSA